VTKTVTLTDAEVQLIKDLLIYAGDHFEADNTEDGQRFTAALMLLMSKLEGTLQLDPDIESELEEWLTDLRVTPPTKVH
jgi:hypothetical protein